MTKPEIKIEPMREGEEDEFINLYCQAFEYREADMFQMMYPMGLSHPDVRRRLKASFLASNKSDTRFTARDASTGELLGVSWWQVTMTPPVTPEAIEAEYQKGLQGMDKLPEVPGMVTELAIAYYKTAFHETHKMVKGRPFVELRILAVRKDCQGRGVGSKLLRHGLEKADELRLPVFVISAVQGKPLYERYGFDEVRDFPLDCRDYGGDSIGLHWTLMRNLRE